MAHRPLARRTREATYGASPWSCHNLAGWDFALGPNRRTLNLPKCVTIERSGYTSRTGQARRRRLSIMLSESEQQRLADIEAALRNDTRFVNGFNRAMTRRVTPRRIIAVCLAAAGVLGVVVGLAAGSVAGTVLAIC